MKKWIIVVIVVAVVMVGGFLLVRARSQNAAAAEGGLQTQPLAKGDLTAIVGATGTVRANQTANLSWQTTGTVKDVNVKEGDSVTSRQVLASLEQTSLPQAVILAQADLVSAQKALDDLRNSQVQQAKAQQTLEQAQQALQDAQDPEQNRSKAAEDLAKAQKAVQDAQTALRSKQSPASQDQIDQAQAQVTFAKDKLDKASEAYQPYANKPESNLTRARLLSAMAQAQQKYDAAVRTLNSLTGVAGPVDQAVAQANLDTAEAQLAQAQRDWERLKDGPTPADIALLEAQVADAQREWDRLKNGPDPADLAAAEARVTAAQATINSAQLTAPFDGVITLVDTQVGDQVDPATPAFRLDDLSSLLVDVPVSEVDISRVKPGQDAALVFDAIANKEYHGKVKEVAQVGTSGQGAVSFTVTVEMTDADQAVKPGMTAAVNMVVDQLKDVLLIPNRAVRTLDSNRVVYVLKNGQPQPVKITLGASSDTMSELLSGDLQVGDLIVLNPPVTFGGGGGGGGPFGGGNNQSSGGNQP